MYQWLGSALSDDAVVVTANRRLARVVRAAYDEQQLTLGRKTWRTPAVFAWGDWLKQLQGGAEAGGSVPLVLNPQSSTLLWERCLREHSTDPFLSFSGVVRQSMQAWQRLFDWRVSLRDLRKAAQSHDERYFAKAAWSYQRILQQNNWTDATGLAPLCMNLLKAESIRLPDKVTLAGFDRVTPAVEAILQQIKASGSAVCFAPLPHAGNACQIATFADSAAELRAAGAWARGALIENSDARLGIVSTSLEADAGRAARLIREGLAPGWQYGSPHYRASVDVSYGRMLADLPVISIALLLLRWALEGLRSRELSLLLRSAFVAGPFGAGRSRLELLLRDVPDRIWTPGEYHRAFHDKRDEPDALAWFIRVQQLEALNEKAKQSGSPAEWAAQIEQVLRAFGWPGVEKPDSEEFQILNRFRKLLNELASVERVAPRMSFTAALRTLRRIAGETVYQPELGPGLLQLLGKLEAAGMEFDKIWVCGLDASRWPAAGHPSPLISRRLQRDHEMPDASTEDTLEHSRRILRRLGQSAAEVVFSWSRADQDAELAPSPLLQEFASRPAEHIIDPGWHALTLLASSEDLESLSDAAPPVAPDERVTGGAYTVQRQVVEPFAAFAYGRLGIADMAPIEIGLAPRLRGSLVHQALHALYSDCPSQTDIQAWTEAETAERIAAAAKRAVASRFRGLDRLHRRLLEFEQQRIGRMLAEFIENEKCRPAFSIFKVEHAVDFARHGVQLGLRMDRLDRIDGDALLVIDYKTGAPKTLLTKDGRPADLQLVVYASALDERIGGLMLINVDTRTISYKSVGSHVQAIPTDTALWADQLANWQQSVDSAMRQIAGGDARINLQLSSADGRALNLLSRLEEHKRER